MNKIPALEQKTSSTGSVLVKFDVDASSGLWNVIFEGFDEELDLISEFTGSSLDAVRVLHSFGRILSKKEQNFLIRKRENGISITKTLSLANQESLIEWTSLMYTLGEQVSEVIASCAPNPSNSDHGFS